MGARQDGGLVLVELTDALATLCVSLPEFSLSPESVSTER